MKKFLSAPLAKWIAEVPFFQPYAHGIALTLTVIALTYFTVVIGELVPKSLALLAPERWASLMARPLSWVAFVSRPLVLLLARSSEWLLEAFGVKKDNEPPVSDNEIRALMVQGTRPEFFMRAKRRLFPMSSGWTSNRLGNHDAQTRYGDNRFERFDRESQEPDCRIGSYAPGGLQKRLFNMFSEFSGQGIY